MASGCRVACICLRDLGEEAECGMEFGSESGQVLGGLL